MDTIFALASGAVPSGIMVIRVSGQAVKRIIQSLTHKSAIARQAVFSKFIYKNQYIDEGLFLYFPAPRSFTGEDVVEFHLHGSRYILDKFYEILSSFKDVRLAERGEFTKRALLNNKIDVTQAEGLNGLVNSVTEQQFQQSMKLYDGTASEFIQGLKNNLTKCIALIEAVLEFPDEGDIEENILVQAKADINKLYNEINGIVKNIEQSAKYRDGFHIVLVGSPNVGKSSLLNYLAGSDLAIVTDIAGTTTDIIETQLDLQGHLIRLSDTAGLRDSHNIIEEIGIQKTYEKLEKADLILYLSDNGVFDLKLPCPILCVNTKSDIISHSDIDNQISISTKTGDGINQLIDTILDFIKEPGNDVNYFSYERHKILFKQAAVAIDSATEQLNKDNIEFSIEDLKKAILSLNEIIGCYNHENMLDSLFKEFCIGK